jgi:hypothetical protein
VVAAAVRQQPHHPSNTSKCPGSLEQAAKEHKIIKAIHHHKLKTMDMASLSIRELLNWADDSA